MLYKPYGQTGKKISAVSFGGMQFKNADDIDANAAIVYHAYQKGINYFDTAPGYCNDKSELIVGAAVQQMQADGKRPFHVSTKSMEADGAALRAQLETSLKRLHVERIDFFHIWCLLTLDGWAERKKGGAVEAALKAKREGLVGHVVVSSHLPGDELAAVLEEGVFEGVTLGYCAANFPYRQKALDAAGRLGLGVVAMNPLGGGIIPKNAAKFDFLRGPGDRSVVEAAIRFVVSQPAMTSALVGFATVDQIDQAVAAVDDFQPYPPARVGEIGRQILASFDGFCTGCGYCLPCPTAVNIPRMMDAYNQKLLGSKDQSVINRLRWHWGLDQKDAAACTQCGVCEQRCTQKLPIRDRLKEIAQLTPEPRK
jgi:hypothetical protein